ncbi:hypothetical protein PoB_007170700 [Plakobranchus ocellatus]|uniref:Uncharacterized protein n=1 Tax=Plakobranchus ocellatus TaxID=259542 RepID=A0AAV4DM68_9GAST|nr:hypothetical protein PoB_007170700 [Plakobranchus ocellatus]
MAYRKTSQRWSRAVFTALNTVNLNEKSLSSHTRYQRDRGRRSQQTSEILFGRRIQGTLPSRIRDTNPKSADIKQRLIDRQNTQKHYYDTHTKELPVLQVNKRVTVQDTTGSWSPATVINHSGDPRSYIVQTDSGQILRRNRLHLRETQVPKEMIASPRSSRGEEHHPLSSQIANNADVIPTNTEPHGSGLGLPSTTKDDDLPGNNSGTNDNAPSSHTSRYGRAIV